MIKKIVVIYHGDCSDGFGGAWAAWKKFGNKADYVPMQHHVPIPQGLIGKEIYFIDFVFKSEAMDQLAKDNFRVTAIDHHITAEASVKKTQKYSYAVNHSGCVLAWKYFHPGKKLPRLLALIEDNDIGKWVIPGSRIALMLMQTIDYDFRQWTTMINGFDDPVRRRVLIAHGKTLLEFEQRMVNTLITNGAELVEFEGHKVFAVNSPIFPTQIGKKLADEHPPMAIIWSKKKDIIAVSLRSNGDVDVSAIAQKYGGGGHKRAAGFSLKIGDVIPWRAAEFTT